MEKKLSVEFFFGSGEGGGGGVGGRHHKGQGKYKLNSTLYRKTHFNSVSLRRVFSSILAS